MAAYTRRFRDGLSTGRAFDAYYGAVQVQALIRGGRVVAINVLRYPAHSGTSRSINRRALPGAGGDQRPERRRPCGVWSDAHQRCIHPLDGRSASLGERLTDADHRRSCG
jgi:hypothetical protein